MVAEKRIHDKAVFKRTPTFGRGFVESVATDGMEVIFGEDRKRMAMNRPEAGS